MLERFRYLPSCAELDRSFEAAEIGAVYVLPERYRRKCRYQHGWYNGLRDQFEVIIKRAGLIQWPRLFHNLRSTRQTELEEKFPTHVVCAWLGNTKSIAARHYLQVTDEHFQRATAQITAQTVANSSGLDTTKEISKSEMSETVCLSQRWSSAETDVPYLGARGWGLGARV